MRVKLSFSPFEISERTKSDYYSFKVSKSANIAREKYLVQKFVFFPRTIGGRAGRVLRDALA